MLVQGCCYAEISQRRGTAERTIANQIAAAFKRLNVSGRSELIQRLFMLDGVASPPAPATTPPPASSALPPTARYPRSASSNEARISGFRALSTMAQLQPALASGRS